MSLLPGRWLGAIFVVALLAAAAGYNVGGEGADEASASSVYFNGYWSSAPQMRRGTLGGLTGISATSFDSAAVAAGNAWDNAPNNNGGDSPSYGWAGAGTTPVGTCSTANQGEVLIGAAYLSTAATTSKCLSGSTVQRATIRLNANNSWAIGAVAGKLDVQSFLTHEAGHAIGWSTHISSNCGDSARNTMCPDLPAGVTWWRTLESIDKYEIDIAYL